MTVKELISMLKELPEDDAVFYYDNLEGDLIYINDITKVAEGIVLSN